MSKKNPRCHFHPDRDAITKCEHCGRLICVECKMVYRKSHSSGSGDTHSYYYTYHDYCTPCFYDRKIKNLNPIGPICIIFFGFIFLGVSIFMLGQAIDFVNSWVNPIDMLPSYFPDSWPQSSNLSAPTFLPMFASIFVLVAIGLIIFGLASLIIAPHKQNALRAKKEIFLESISSQSRKPIEDIPLKYTYCPSCGAQDDYHAKYCSKCGCLVETVKI